MCCCVSASEQKQLQAFCKSCQNMMSQTLCGVERAQGSCARQRLIHDVPELESASASLCIWLHTKPRVRRGCMHIFPLGPLNFTGYWKDDSFSYLECNLLCKNGCCRREWGCRCFSCKGSWLQSLERAGHCSHLHPKAAKVKMTRHDMSKHNLSGCLTTVLQCSIGFEGSSTSDAAKKSPTCLLAEIN